MLYEKIKSLVYIKDNPAFANFDAIGKSLYLTKEISAALFQVYRGIRDGEDSEASIDEISEALEKFYDEYIAPVDLPMGDFVEMVFDNQVPKFFKPAIEALHEKLAQKGSE